jgi:SET domain-containing protein
LALDVVAIRDIKAGEELTIDYGLTLWFTPQ